MKAIEGIREYERKALSGPWDAEFGRNDNRTICLTVRLRDELPPMGWMARMPPEVQATNQFVINARTDLPLLLAVVEAADKLVSVADQNEYNEAFAWHDFAHQIALTLEALEREWSGAHKQEQP